MKKILTPGERWEQGIEHHPQSIRLFRQIARYDWELNNDYFRWKSGGDGDNGEQLLYLLDIIVEQDGLVDSE